MERGETRANESRPRDQQEDLWDGGGGAGGYSEIWVIEWR